MLSRRENYIKTINHEQPERILIDFGGNPLSSMEGKSMFNLLQFLGYDISVPFKLLRFGKVPRLDERLLEHFDIDTRSVGGIMMPQNSQFQQLSETEYIDEWGIQRKYYGLYWENVGYPLKGANISDLEKYKWPNAESIDSKEIEATVLRAKDLFEHSDYVVVAEHPVYGVFELGCWLCGFEDFLLKMALMPEFVHRLFEIIFNYQQKVIEMYYGMLGKYIHYTTSGDDFATQEALFISPQMWREFIMPYFKARIKYTKKFTDAKFLHHSCGSIFQIIQDLIEAGVEILNPIQPKARDMQPKKLKAFFSDNIVFHGGFDTQGVLPFGSKEQIYAEVQQTMKTLGVNGGYIFAAAHNIQEDVPPANVVHMLEAARYYATFERFGHES